MPPGSRQKGRMPSSARSWRSPPLKMREGVCAHFRVPLSGSCSDLRAIRGGTANAAQPLDGLGVFLAVGSVGRNIGGQLSFPAVAVREQLFLVIEEFFTGFRGELE